MLILDYVKLYHYLPPLNEQDCIFLGLPSIIQSLQCFHQCYFPHLLWQLKFLRRVKIITNHKFSIALSLKNNL